MTRQETNECTIAMSPKEGWARVIEGIRVEDEMNCAQTFSLGRSPRSVDLVLLIDGGIVVHSTANPGVFFCFLFLTKDRSQKRNF